MDKPKFSVVMIMRNEEKVLPRLLMSLEEFRERGGEVVCVDTGSTDNSVKLARDWGVKVTEAGEKFLHTIGNHLASKINKHFVVDNEEPVVTPEGKYFDFASARNYAISLCSNDWTCSVDADEELTVFDIDAINKVISAPDLAHLEYEFIFSHDQYGKPAIQFKQSKFFNRKKIQWVNIVHEVISPINGGGRREYLPPTIFKLDHWQIPGDRHSYLRGLAVDCYLHPESDRNSHYFARELMWNGRPKSAIKEFKRHITMHGWIAEQAQSMVFIGDCYGYINKPDQQVEWYNKAFYTDSNRRVALIKLAEFYRYNNVHLATAAYATAAMQIPWTDYYANDKSHYENLPHELLYWAKGWTGDIEAAKFHINKALEYQPLNHGYLRDLRYYYKLPTVSFIIPTLGREEGLKACVDSIKALNYPQELIDIKIIDGPGTVPNKVKQGVDETKGDYIVYGSNDCTFSQDSLILNIRESMQNNKRLVAFDTGVRNTEGYINEHFLIKRDLLPLIDGEIFDTDFFHVGVDDLLWKKCDKIGEAMIGSGKVEHHHFSRLGSGIKKDEIIEKGWSHAEEDRKLLKKKLNELYGK